MKKAKKWQLILFLVLLATAFSTVISVVFSNLLFFSLNGDTDKIIDFTSLLTIEGFFEQEEQRLLFLLCLMMCVVTCIALVMMNANKETFESDTTMITDKITTPVAIGQGQYGTARWLSKKEVAKEYTQVTVYSHDKELIMLAQKAHDEKETILGGEKTESNNPQNTKSISKESS